MSEAMRREWEKLRADFERMIAKDGQAVTIVYPTVFDPPDTLAFMYTIGNYGRGLPELLVVGTDSVIIANVLNRLGRIQRERGTPFADEELVSVGGKFSLRIVDAGEIGRTQYAISVGKYYDTQDYEVRQVLLPDLQGRWPDTPGCDLPYAEQPVLSKFARHGGGGTT